MTEISLYVPCYNARRFLPATLEAVSKQSLPPDEILVVDDGSDERISDIVEEHGAGMIRHRTNLGLAAARNTAIRASRGSLIAALDADCVPTADWLERMKLYHQRKGLDGCGGRVIDRFRTSPADHWRTAHLLLDLGEEERTGLAIPGANTLFRKSALVDAGYYDPRYRNAGEDVDICRRVLARGGRIGYVPSAVVYHARRDTPRSVAKTHWRYVHAGDDHYVDKPVARHWMNELLTGFRWVLADVKRGNFRDIRLDIQIPFYLMQEDLMVYKPIR